MTRIVCCGEGMLELARHDAGSWNLGFGGDTLNTAVHLARMDRDVAYLTALGKDIFSEQLRQQWRAEGVDTGLVLEHPTRSVGLYAINTDDRGERSFVYWREWSAAREMFSLAESAAAVDQASRAGLLYFSLLTLAILPPEARRDLLSLADRIRSNGGRVAYDNNYRARLWPRAEDAVATHEAAIAVADIGLPTLEDETELTGIAEACDLQQRWTELGCADVVVKLGASGCLLPTAEMLAPETPITPVDTSGAGDAFNAGYLAGILKGLTPRLAAESGQRLAGWVISRSGAIPPRDKKAPYA